MSISSSQMSGVTFAEDPHGALAEYAKSGMHVEPAVFALDLCDELVSLAYEFPAVQAGDYRTALQPHKRSGVFLKALRHPRVTEIIRRILGDQISGIQTQFFYGRPGTPGFQPHQDNRFVNAPQGKFASAWIALTDVSREIGGLYIYPGSFREPLLDVEEVDAPETNLQDMNALRLRCRVPEIYKPVDLTIPKGGAAFFDGNTVHGSYTNVSQRNRYALLMTYVTRGAPFVPGRYAEREEVFID